MNKLANIKIEELIKKNPGTVYLKRSIKWTIF